MPVVRGYSFGANEFATAEKLHRLVDAASVTGLTTAEFDGDIRGLVTATPASISDGTVMFLHETSASLVTPSALSQAWTHPTYLVHYFGHWVGLFAGDRLESGRFFVGPDFTGSPMLVGAALLSEGLTSQGAATLLLGDVATAPPKTNTIGAALRTRAEDQAMRACLIGYSPIRTSAQESGTPWFDRLYDGGGTDSDWAKSSASDVSGYYGYRLNNVGLGDTALGRAQPGYLLGAMIFSA